MEGDTLGVERSAVGFSACSKEGSREDTPPVPFSFPSSSSVPGLLVQMVRPPCVAVGESCCVEVRTEVTLPTDVLPAQRRDVCVVGGWLLQLKRNVERERVPIKQSAAR